MNKHVQDRCYCVEATSGRSTRGKGSRGDGMVLSIVVKFVLVGGCCCHEINEWVANMRLTFG